MEEELKTRKYPSIVEQIHHEFNTAGDNLLKEALFILKKESDFDSTKGELLTKYGFVNVPQTEQINLKKATIVATTAIANKIKQLSKDYPNYKYITKDSVNIINEKYNLVFGPIELYKGFVPKNNLLEIDNFFKQRNLKSIYRITNIQFLSSATRNDKNMIIEWMKDNFYLVSEDILFNYSNTYVEAYLNMYLKDNKIISDDAIYSAKKVKVDSPLFICAPKADMKDLKWYEKAFAPSYSTYPDPVVLYPIDSEGYLIVTAWGDEASDLLVVNEKLN